MTNSQDTHVLSVEHFGITVADLDRSADFFCNVLGFRRTRESHTYGDAARDVTGVDDADILHIFLTAAGIEIELLAYQAAEHSGGSVPGPETPGSMHLALRVNNLDDVVRCAKDYGWAPPGRPHVMTTGPRTGFVMSYLRDERGATLELIQGRRPTD